MLAILAIYYAAPFAIANAGLHSYDVRPVSDKETHRWHGKEDRLRALTVAYVLAGLGFIATGIDGASRGWSLAALVIVTGVLWILVGANFGAVRQVVTRAK